ncbi:hypothetical protein pb186bvf_014451 [Paramecium bursaria]
MDQQCKMCKSAYEPELLVRVICKHLYCEKCINQCNLQGQAKCIVKDCNEEFSRGLLKVAKLNFWANLMIKQQFQERINQYQQQDIQQQKKDQQRRFEYKICSVCKKVQEALVLNQICRHLNCYYCLKGQYKKGLCLVEGCGWQLNYQEVQDFMFIAQKQLIDNKYKIKLLEEQPIPYAFQTLNDQSDTEIDVQHSGFQEFQMNDISLNSRQYKKLFNDVIAKNKQFVDPDFLPEQKSLGSKIFGWAKVSDIFQDNYQVFQKDEKSHNRFGLAKWIGPNDIKQGALGNCYFLAAVAAICNRRPDILLEDFVTQQINKAGIYGIRFCLNGVWKIIFIDDYFPVCGNQPAFSQPINNAIWVMILEKAWAKISGDYSKTDGGFMTEALNTLTGASTETIFTNIKDFKQQLAQLLDQRVIMCAATPKKNENDDVLPNGLVTRHAYSILKIKTITHPEKQLVELVKLRNPWGKKEWKGDWGFDSPLWTPELKLQVKLDKDRGGVFYMDYNQFIKEFSYIDVCHVRKSYILSSHEIPSQKNHATYLNFKIDIDKVGEYFISLTQKNVRFQNSPKCYSLGKLIVIGKVGNNIHEIIEQKADNKLEVWTKNILTAGEYFIYSKVQWAQCDFEVYGISIYGPSKVDLLKMDQKPRNLLKQAFIRMAKKQQNKIRKDGFPQLQNCQNFNLQTKFGYYYIENTSDQNVKVSITFKLKHLKIRKPAKGDKFNLQIQSGQNELFIFKIQSGNYKLQDSWE